MDVSVINMGVRLNIFEASAQPLFEDESGCFFVDMIDSMVEEALPAILSIDPLGTCLFHGDMSLFDL